MGLASSASADNGNRLIAVDDEVSLWSELEDFRDNGYYYHQHGQAEYDYDYNGNMVFDLHREMKIEYTQTTNLPKIIGWRRGTIENHYTFDGQKLGKKVYDYRGNLTLNERYFDELLMQNGKVRRLQHADGYISLTQDGNPVEYFYYLKDHLGNIRATITQATPDSLLITQANDYYPFGMAYTPKLTGLQPESWNNKFKYNLPRRQAGGKEEQEMPGGWLSRKLSGGARMYDPTLGRWHVVDPMSEIARRWTPYQYAYSNPIRFIDPDGMVVGDYYDQKGNYLGTDGNDDQKNYVVTDKKEAKQIKKATKSDENYTASVDSKVELPGYGVRSAMGEAVDRAGSNAFHEEGGVIANMSDGSKKVVNAKPGADADPSVDSYAEIDVLDAADPSEVKGYSTLDGTFHTHPDGTVTESSSGSGSSSGTTIGGTKTTHSFVQSPSDVDISTHAARSKRGLVTGNSYVLGTGNNTVYIYNGKGVQATFPLQKFRTKLKNE